VACSRQDSLSGDWMNTKDTMNSTGAEVEGGDILEAEVVDSRQPAPSGRLVGMALLLALIALIVAAGGAFYSYQLRESAAADIVLFRNTLDAARNQNGEVERQLAAALDSYKSQGRQLAEQKQVLAEQQQALATHKQLLKTQGAKLESERARLEQVGQEIRKSIQSVHRRIGGDNSHWMAAEAAYLIQLAIHRLHLEWDVQTAVSALQAADSRLRDSNDPVWIPVREILALEINSLKGIALIDIEGQALRLSGLAGGVKTLKLLGAERVSAAPAEKVSAAEPDAGERTFKTLLHDGWQGFKSIMVIRHHGQPVSALLPPDQQLFIQQNLRLQLEAARISLLRGNQALFDTSLQTAVQLVKEYFDTNDSKAASFLKEVGELSTFNVRPQLPDISTSLIALRELLGKAGEN